MSEGAASSFLFLKFTFFSWRQTLTAFEVRLLYISHGMSRFILVHQLQVIYRSIIAYLRAYPFQSEARVTMLPGLQHVSVLYWRDVHHTSKRYSLIWRFDDDGEEQRLMSWLELSCLLIYFELWWLRVFSFDFPKPCPVWKNLHSSCFIYSGFSFLICHLSNSRSLLPLRHNVMTMSF